MQAAPTLAGELRWPWVRHTGAADHVIEPVVQVVYVRALQDQDEIPNEDSRLPEFDETNLFAFNRFPGLDRLETGLRANMGISYTRQDPSGWSAGFTLGRILRADPVDDFAAGTGLDGRWSNYVAAVSVDFAWGLTAINRALFDTGMGFRRNEFALAYDGEFGARPRRLRLPRRGRLRPRPRLPARDERGLARRPLPGAPELGAARALALRRRRPLEPARRRRDHLRQRVRRVRPFRLAPLHLIG